MDGLPLIVRRAGPHEKDLILSGWKHSLEGCGAKWRRGLTDRDFWCLVNYAVDRIAFPSSLIFVGCHETDRDVPIGWVAIRRLAGLSTYEVVYLHMRSRVRADAGLAEAVERQLLHEISRQHPIAAEFRPFNPFLELRRP